MAKYPFELKLKIVKEYLSGVGGYRHLANKNGISSKSQVSDWVNAYREYGEEGLLRKHQNQKHSVQFKLIANWMRNFREAGIEGSQKRKGDHLL